MKNHLFSLLFFGLSFSIFAQNQFIPQPKSLEIKQGEFIVPAVLYISSDLPSEESDYLIERLAQHFTIKKTKDSKAQIVGSPTLKNSHEEAYELEITPTKINITYRTNTGYFRALQSLAQLLEEHRFDKKFPAMKIVDEPKFKWRGMHLDVVRHFFNKEEVKNYIDYLAFYKMNTFHWHLTDDQGWRIEIKKYPKLTEVGSKRKESMIGPYAEMQFDGTPYEGFFTQDEIKEVIEYARKRHITIVPEIEMPGHALAALTSYPHLGCTGGPYEVATLWGVFDDVFCPKDETFEFLQDVLDEVMALFPSEYIHIGGDECPKTRWKECAHCQALIQSENLKNEDELQSYFIKRIERYVNSKGRKIIGWNEILEGGLAPNAAVMSWTGEEGGIEAARMGNYAVMTPGSYCYFDHYQGDPQNEPVAFGGHTSLEKVYSYNPIPTALSTEEGKYILGVQANLWAEYILDFKHIEYMLFPRLMALSEVAWGTNQPDEYLAFENKAVSHFELLDEKGIHYAKSIFNPSGRIVQKDGGLFYEIYTSKNPNNIRYTTDGTEPNTQSIAYQSPIPLNGKMTIRSAYFEDGELKSAVSSQDFNLSKSSGKDIQLVTQPNENYSSGGALTLVDGVVGNPKILGKTWLGFWGPDVLATIDLGEATTFTQVTFNSLDNKGSWIHLAGGAKVYVSDDGKDFKMIKEINRQEILEVKGRVKMEVGSQKARFVKVEIFNAGTIPSGNPGAGSDPWLFVDEIGIW